MERIQLVDVADLERSLSSDYGGLDEGLAQWAIDMVSAAALDITKASWQSPLDVPPGAMAVLAMAVRRLYVNPDRFTRESEGDYSYAFDSTVTKADIFTPPEKATLMEYRAGAARIRGLGTVGTFRGDIGLRTTCYVPDGTAHGFPWWEAR